MHPRISAIIIGVVAIIIGLALINIGQSFPQAWAMPWAGIAAMGGGGLIIYLAAKG